MLRLVYGNLLQRMPGWPSTSSAPTRWASVDRFRRRWTGPYLRRSRRDRRRHVRDPAQHHRRAVARAAEGREGRAHMDLMPSAEQDEITASVAAFLGNGNPAPTAPRPGHRRPRARPGAAAQDGRARLVRARTPGAARRRRLRTGRGSADVPRARARHRARPVPAGGARGARGGARRRPRLAGRSSPGRPSWRSARRSGRPTSVRR